MANGSKTQKTYELWMEMSLGSLILDKINCMCSKADEPTRHFVVYIRETYLHIEMAAKSILLPSTVAWSDLTTASCSWVTPL